MHIPAYSFFFFSLLIYIHKWQYFYYTSSVNILSIYTPNGIIYISKYFTFLLIYIPGCKIFINLHS